MQAAPLITEELLDEDFFAELDALIDKDFEENKEIQEENRNCGTGAVGGKQGFQPGNKCAGTGEKSKGKAEGKKKSVHSDWDDGKTAAEAGWFYTEKVTEPSGSPFEPPVVNTVEHKGISENEFKGAANEFTTDKGRKVWTRLYPINGDTAPTRDVEFAVDGDISVTNGGEAMSIIRGVSNNIVSLYNDENIDGITFSALRMDGSGRTRLYSSLSKRIAKKTDSEAFASIKNMKSGRKTPETKFYVVKKSALKKFKKNPTIFPTDGDLFDPKPVTGRPAGKWLTVPIGDFDWGTAFEEQYNEEERSSEEKRKPWFLDELLKDENFVEQVEKMLESDETRNCGTGAVGGKQGFQPGNKCAGTGEKSKGKAEGKKKDVHSDWDDGATVDKHWDYDATKDQFRSSFSTYAPEDEDGIETEYFYDLEADRDTGHPVADLIKEAYGGEDSPFYDVQFSLENGKNRFRIQDTKTAQQVFRKVTNRMLSLYDLYEVDGLIFSSSRNEPSRTKLYHFLSKFAQKRRGIKALIDNNYRNKIVFHLINEKMADDYKEIYRLQDKPLYWVDETSREDLDIAGVL